MEYLRWKTFQEASKKKLFGTPARAHTHETKYIWQILEVREKIYKTIYFSRENVQLTLDLSITES